MFGVLEAKHWAIYGIEPSEWNSVVICISKFKHNIVSIVDQKVDLSDYMQNSYLIALRTLSYSLVHSIENKQMSLTKMKMQ